MEQTLYPPRMKSPWRIALGLFCLWAAFTFHFESGFMRFLALLGGIFSLMPGYGWLKLDQDGFTFKSLFSTSTTPWANVESFGVITYRALVFIPINRQVGWRIAKNVKRPMIQKAAGALARYDAVLPDTYGMKATELADLLEAWRVRALASQRVA